jgi:hypothetical protein
MLESTTALLATAITNPWMQSKSMRGCDLDPGTGQCFLTQSAAAAPSHILPPRAPPSLDSRCSAVGPEPEAPDNGQAIDAGQAAVRIHHTHHSNERPVGGAKTGWAC